MRNLLIQLLMVFLGMQTSVAFAEEIWPDVIRVNDSVKYMTGGIDVDQSTLMLNASKDWPITLVFAEIADKRAEYLSDVKVLLTNQKKEVVLDINSDGPIALIDVPAGNYNLDVTFNGSKLTRKISLKNKPLPKINLLWSKKASSETPAAPAPAEKAPESTPTQN